MKKFILIAISIMTFFAMSLTSFAATGNFPKFVPQDGYGYLEYYNGTEYRVLTYDSSTNITLYYASSNNSINCYGTGSVHSYFYNSTMEKWTYNLQYDITATKPKSLSLGSGGYMVKSSVNVYDSSTNELVFPLPPSLMEVTEEGLQKMTHSLGGVAKTITLCGVGCLALLIGLNLLRRKSLIFLNR